MSELAQEAGRLARPPSPRPAPPPAATPPPAPGLLALAAARITPAQLLTTAWLRRRALLLAFLLPTAAGLGLALLRPPLFQAEMAMLVQVSREALGGQDIAGLGPMVMSVEQLKVVRAEMEIATSAPVLRAAAERLGPATVLPGIDSPSLWPWRRPPPTPEARLALAAEALGRLVKAETEPSTNILRLTARASERERAIALVRAVGEAYLRQRGAVLAEGAARLLGEDLSRQSAELRELEREIAAAKLRFEVTDLAQDIALAANRLDGLLLRENALREQRAAAEAQLAAGRQALAAMPERVFAGSDAATAGPNDEIRNTLARLLQEREHLQRHYAPGDPLLRDLEGRIAIARQTLAQSGFATRREVRNPAWDQLNARVAQLQIEAESLGRQLEEVRRLRAEAEQRRATLLSAETVLRDLTRRRDALEGILRTFTTREAGVRLEEDARRSGGAAVQVVQPATAPLSGESRAPLFAAAGLSGGLTLSGGLLLLLTATRRSLVTRAEARETLGLPALAGFPPLGPAPREEPALAELAALLLDARRGRGEGAAVLLLPAGAGADERQGLARALALEAGARARRPTLLLDLESDGAAHLRALGGAPEPVEERVPGHVLAFPTACETLWVANESQHSHLTDPHAGMAEAERLLGLLRREFELILMVGGPPGESYALRRLAALADATVPVVNAATTTLPAARAAVEALRAAGAALPGFVFTGEARVLPPGLARLVGVEAG
ncbi:GumC domain-containing protein [Rubritepida flocculans]|uniref:hypothetical protein n=1 Tax=Rubritepida flocculans TaxID=182403 RepID=UPI000419D27D|nr:hypothetical protein [Rubritepida flocculans]